MSENAITVEWPSCRHGFYANCPRGCHKPTPRCPGCGEPEIEAATPRTVYACGSSDYDQRPGTFVSSHKQKPVEAIDGSRPNADIGPGAMDRDALAGAQAVLSDEELLEPGFYGRACARLMAKLKELEDLSDAVASRIRVDDNQQFEVIGDHFALHVADLKAWLKRARA